MKYIPLGLGEFINKEYDEARAYTAYRTSQDAFFRRETIRRGFENPISAVAIAIVALEVFWSFKDEPPAVNDLLLCRPCT